MINYHEVIDFWFKEISPEQWFEKDSKLDLKMKQRFATLHSSVVAGECSSWRIDPIGRFAEILVIDQFSRTQDLIFMTLWRLCLLKRQ